MVDPSYVDEPDHWRKRAEEARNMAEKIDGSQAKDEMLQIAEHYERLAKRAQARAMGRPPNSN
jgi:hypothetical protein